MDAERRFAAERVARLATIGPGGPHIVPVVFAVGANCVYLAIDHKPKTTRRLRRLANIAANPDVSLIVDRYDEDWSALWWVRVDGTARVVDADSVAGVAAIDALVAKYAQYSGARPEGPAIVVSGLRWSAWSAQI
ncbi:TIGR03668 family PPOX class F420-dependent oxidoreductase [Antrihabitans sp. YC2-6]|uniref:TIGR03668 family PPOX class F420-dependent oxidoreductase n=1 Tax=Antrihabitans sp. YC2-6 TaxID=2799498 RepID=UPI0018F52477|nr:TIGR03668 family PPOX class F420-dependent oxidoreductase [Antrihabitans sp. YC2-6]MBJ8343467.1 TIGR03668 family PPOX class F420-dependent oxidoreductase [Antrihabitans sp. YC2-6]